jgi:hypothetical protein
VNTILPPARWRSPRRPFCAVMAERFHRDVVEDFVAERQRERDLLGVMLGVVLGVMLGVRALGRSRRHDGRIHLDKGFTGTSLARSGLD